MESWLFQVTAEAIGSQCEVHTQARRLSCSAPERFHPGARSWSSLEKVKARLHIFDLPPVQLPDNQLWPSFFASAFDRIPRWQSSNKHGLQHSCSVWSALRAMVTSSFSQRRLVLRTALSRTCHGRWAQTRLYNGAQPSTPTRSHCTSSRSTLHLEPRSPSFTVRISECPCLAVQPNHR